MTSDKAESPIKDNATKITIYAGMPDGYHRWIRKLAGIWECSEWEAINIVWKCRRNPRREGESDIAYFERIEGLPDAPS